MDQMQLVSSIYIVYIYTRERERERERERQTDYVIGNCCMWIVLLESDAGFDYHALSMATFVIV